MPDRGGLRLGVVEDALPSLPVEEERVRRMGNCPLRTRLDGDVIRAPDTGQLCPRPDEEPELRSDGTRAENINLTIPAFGVLTGAGTVSPSNALNFKMTANLSGGAVTGVTQMAGLGSKGGAIPFFIQGTTSDPKFVPDVKGMASGVAGGLLQQTLQGNQSTPGQNNPLGGLTGLFKKKKPK